LLYAIFYLKEVKQEKAEDAAYDNPAMETDLPLPNRNNESRLQISEPPTVEEAKNVCLEFFDPRLALECIKSFVKKREYGVRSIIILLMSMHFLTNGVANGETQNLFLYQRAKLNWDIDYHTYHTVFSIVLGLVGTLLMIGVLSKYMKISDIVLTMLSTALTFTSRVIYSFATTTVGFFAGTAVDFTFSVKFLTVRSIISKLVPSEDLSTMFAVMGLFEAFAGVIFPYLYPTFYQYLLADSSRDVSEMFMLSAGFVLISFITYS
jgi:MFS transporter, PCFT/HCP family, solute carrier family 46, member 3